MKLLLAVVKTATIKKGEGMTMKCKQLYNTKTFVLIHEINLSVESVMENQSLSQKIGLKLRKNDSKGKGKKLEKIRNIPEEDDLWDFKAWFDKGKKFEKIRNIPEEDGLWDLKAWFAHINSLCTSLFLNKGNTSLNIINKILYKIYIYIYIYV